MREVLLGKISRSLEVDIRWNQEPTASNSKTWMLDLGNNCRV